MSFVSRRHALSTISVCRKNLKAIRLGPGACDAKHIHRPVGDLRVRQARRADEARRRVEATRLTHVVAKLAIAQRTYAVRRAVADVVYGAGGAVINRDQVRFVRICDDIQEYHTGSCLHSNRSESVYTCVSNLKAPPTPPPENGCKMPSFKILRQSLRLRH